MLKQHHKETLTNLTPWSRVLQKLTVTQSRSSPPSMEPQVSLPCSQQPASGTYPEPHKSNPQLSTLFP